MHTYAYQYDARPAATARLDRQQTLRERTSFRSVSSTCHLYAAALRAAGGRHENAEQAARLFEIVRGSASLGVSQHGAFRTPHMYVARDFIEAFSGEFDDADLYGLSVDACRADDEADGAAITSLLVGFVMSACPRRIKATRAVIDEMIALLTVAA